LPEEQDSFLGVHMKMKIEEMAMELLGLPAAQRALLAKQLIASLDET
jgi:hypothetical protein